MTGYGGGLKGTDRVLGPREQRQAALLSLVHSPTCGGQEGSWSRLSTRPAQVLGKSVEG